jgi:isoquinoline 1-oxidoreductase subunit alpha
MEKTIELSINKKKHKIDAPADMPLLWAIRDIIGLTGTKFGCGQALCGACTVHINGVPVRSCSTPLAEALGKEVTTIEGVPASHPIKKAWEKFNVPQCGYCQSGQIMSATALLTKHKHPTSDQIDEAMAGNICRCGTYCRIKKAIQNV